MGLLEKLGFVGREQFDQLKEKVDAVDRTQAVIEFDLQGNILSANKNFLELMGYELDEIVGRHHSMFVSAEDANSSAYQDLWRDLGVGRHVVSEFKRVKKNGDIVWIQGAYNPLLDDAGRPHKVIKYAVDVSDKKYQSQLARALQLCQANVMLVDREDNITYINNTMEASLKYNQAELRSAINSFSPDSLVGQNIEIFNVDRSYQDKMLALSDQAYGREIKIGKLLFDLIVTPWYGVSGKRIGTLVEWEDKTERVERERRERKTAQENERIRKALDVCNTAVMTTDRDLTIIYLNAACEAMLQRREAKVQQALPDFSASSIVGRSLELFNTELAQQNPLSSTYRTRLEISGLTFQLIATPVLSENGDYIGASVEWEDLTERLSEEEKQRKIAEENARVRQALDQVSTNVMITDSNANIIYLNKSADELMKVAQQEIRKKIVQVGRDLKTTHRSSVQSGGRYLDVVANPVVQGSNRVGSVFEWQDLTEESAIQQEVDLMVEAANQGNFSVNIKSAGKSGFFLNLCNGLNNLVGTVEVALNDILRMLGAIAKGDLSERITRDYQGAFGQLKNDANLTAEKLTEVVAGIRESADSISLSVGEIVNGNNDLSQRTESQASSLQQTAASMEQMTSTVKQSANNAGRADGLVTEAQKLAKEGGTVVDQAVVAMGEINDSSKKINDIISVIDEIAFQTNLLALNAAVEAARAGDQGRGFAVVAGEVRNLAQRSAGAAKEIKELISDSVSKVSYGTDLVNRSGAVLQEIVGAVDNVTMMMREISSAAKEQSSGIEQVNAAIMQMDQVTQQNAALVEQATAAGQTMLDQTTVMIDVVAFFSGANEYVSPPEEECVDLEEPEDVAPSFENTKPIIASDDEWEEF